MLVFIRMVPASVTNGDLRHFVDRGMGSMWDRFFGRRGNITASTILRFTNPKTQSVEYHGVVDIEPATSAQAMIKKLNRTPLNGVPVEVRKFYHRSALRDRRKDRLNTETGSVTDMRRGNRRRSHMNIEPVSISGPVEAGRA
ncbi:MAG: RNA-binding protein [Sedimenticola sp.]